MVKRTSPTNYQLKELLLEIESKAGSSHFWKRIAQDIKKPTRQRRTVNVYKIDQFAQEGEIIVVPGKVLSVGSLSKKVDVAAMNFSSEARKKIIEAKGKALSIKDLLQKNPEGKNVRIIG